MCDRSRFNRTKRNLLSVIEEIGKQSNLMVSSFSSRNRIVDGFPLPVCKFGRAPFHKTFKGYDADYRIYVSKKETYYGYKVHTMTTFEEYITNFTITKASIDDREALWDLVDNYHNPLLIIGDNSKEAYPKWIRKIIFEIRRRIETTFSQLTEQLNAEVVRVESLWGLKTRIQTKILAYNLCFFVN